MTQLNTEITPQQIFQQAGIPEDDGAIANQRPL